MNQATRDFSPTRGGLAIRVLLVLGLLFLLGSILWVVLLPGIVVTKIRAKTGFAVKVEKLSVNPFTAKVHLTGLVVKNPEGWPVPDFVDLREFRADANLFSLFSSRLVADEIIVDVAQLTLVKNQQGLTNAMAFQQGLTGRGQEPAGAKAPGAKKEFLIRHLVLKFDKIVYADHSGRKPVVKEFNLNLNQDMRDVDSVAKLVSPFSNAAVGLLTDPANGIFKNNPELLKGVSGTLQEAGKKAGEKLKGLLDSLDKKKP